MAQRFLARLIDGIAVGVPIAIVTAVLPLGFIIEGALSSIAYFGYFIMMEGKDGKTIGKNVMHLQVVRDDGQPMTQDVAIQRNLWLLLGVVPFLGGLASLVVVIYIAITISGSAEGRGWHDERAHAHVVVA